MIKHETYESLVVLIFEQIRTTLVYTPLKDSGTYNLVWFKKSFWNE